MPAPNDLSSQIAFLKGWTWYEEPQVFRDRYGARWITRHWRNPEGKPTMRPDFVGTLEGVSGMLWELNKPRSIWDDTLRWVFYWEKLAKQFVCEERVYVENAAPAFCVQKRRQFWSPDDHPGDCVGEAYVCIFGKEIDANTTD